MDLAFHNVNSPRASFYFPETSFPWFCNGPWVCHGLTINCDPHRPTWTYKQIIACLVENELQKDFIYIPLFHRVTFLRNKFESLTYLFIRGSSVASSICQEGQSERNFPMFAFSSRFFLFFPDFSWFFPDFSWFFPRFLANFSLSGVALCPPCHPYGYATD